MFPIVRISFSAITGVVNVIIKNNIKNLYLPKVKLAIDINGLKYIDYWKKSGYGKQISIEIGTQFFYTKHCGVLSFFCKDN